MNQENKVCCNRCKDYDPCYKISCRCHTNKGECDTSGKRMDWCNTHEQDVRKCPVPTQQEKCCENGLKKAGAGTVPCFKVPTQPESKGWEERLKSEFPYLSARRKTLVDFISQEIAAAEERGKIGTITNFQCSEHTDPIPMCLTCYQEDVKEARSDILAELEEKLPPENEKDTPLGNREDSSHGYNQYRVEVLDIINSLKNK